MGNSPFPPCSRSTEIRTSVPRNLGRSMVFRPSCGPFKSLTSGTAPLRMKNRLILFRLSHGEGSAQRLQMAQNSRSDISGGLLGSTVTDAWQLKTYLRDSKLCQKTLLTSPIQDDALGISPTSSCATCCHVRLKMSKSPSCEEDDAA